MAFFAQDSWKVRPNLTLNYGVRYDYELTEQIPTLPLRDPLSGINLSAARCSGRAGRDGCAARISARQEQLGATVWQSRGIRGTTARQSIRAAFGIFYDHPLLAIAFNSDIADAVQQQQGILTPG